MRRRSAALRAAGLLAAVVLAALVVNLLVLEAVYVSSRSMEPAILQGDYLIVDKLGFFPAGLGLRSPARGDVVAVESPEGDLLIKRCIALPGDTVRVERGLMTVNGAVAAREVLDPGPFFAPGAAARIPARGDALVLDSAGCARWRGLIAGEGRAVGDRTADGLTVDGEPARAYTVERDYLFLLGDNHAVSSDSRSWGPVDAGRVAGVALLVYWSARPEGGLRAGRIGTIVR